MLQLPALGAASPPLSERIPLSAGIVLGTEPGEWACIANLSTELAEAGMSALSAVLPSWSTVLLVLLIVILSLNYWVVKGVSVETLLASYRLVNQGKAIRIQLRNEKVLALKVVLSPGTRSSNSFHRLHMCARLPA